MDTNLFSLFALSLGLNWIRWSFARDPPTYCIIIVKDCNIILLDFKTPADSLLFLFFCQFHYVLFLAGRVLEIYILHAFDMLLLSCSPLYMTLIFAQPNTYSLNIWRNMSLNKQRLLRGVTFNFRVITCWRNWVFLRNLIL
jgi:hypothetical protein